ncbi:DUF302 domain-containing protein [Sinomonas sp. G460-2]|uniref:DUF302 domain-containing protein n=1 Tax=Sinomonas sp. G460-2 TaxID=3393464 RepID=UPI0039EDFCC1
MADFTLTATVAVPHDKALALVRDALVDAGFGVLTEIDLSATFRAKLGVEIPPQVILGACRPQLARAALLADPRIAALLPCNVVVTSAGDDSTTVTVLDPDVLHALTDHPDLVNVVADARKRISQMLNALTATDKEPENATGA